MAKAIDVTMESPYFEDKAMSKLVNIKGDQIILIMKKGGRAYAEGFRLEDSEIAIETIPHMIKNTLERIKKDESSR